jgi:hypothetical protein
MREWYRSLSDPTKAAISTAIFTFISTSALAILNILARVQEWVNGGDPITFEDVSIVGKVVIGAVISAVTGLVNYGFRAWQRRQDPTSGPRYQN